MSAETCTVTFGSWARYSRCAAAAVETLLVGCTHEHLMTQRLCAEHRYLFTGDVGAVVGNCHPCETSRAPHDCAVRVVRRTPLPAPATTG